MKFLRKGFLLILAILLLMPWDSNAGFWVKKPEMQPAKAAAANPQEMAATEYSPEALAEAAYSSSAQQITAVKEHKQTFFNKLQHKLAVYKQWFAPKRWFAIFLSILDITVLGYLGFPRFYLGYRREGFLQLLLTLLGLGGVALVYMAASTGEYTMFLPGAFLIGVGLFSAIWQIIDAFRIWINTLKPKRGYWAPPKYKV